MKKAFITSTLISFLILISTSIFASDSYFEKTIVKPVWVNSWHNMIFKQQNDKSLEFKQNFNAFSTMHLKFTICNTYYSKTGNTLELGTIQKHAAYFMSASVKMGVIRKDAEQPALKDATTPKANYIDEWNSTPSKLLKAKQLCTDISKKIAAYEKKTNIVIAEEFKKVEAKLLINKQPKKIDSKQLNYPMVVATLLNFKNPPQDIDTILAGIKGADNNGNAIYSGEVMGKMYKKGYLGGYAMGVESYCPKIPKVFLTSPNTKNGNGVWVETKENGQRSLKWKQMNMYHSQGLKDGWRTAQQQGCNHKVAQSIAAAETASLKLRVCFFGVCQ